MSISLRSMLAQPANVGTMSPASRGFTWSGALWVDHDRQIWLNPEAVITTQRDNFYAVSLRRNWRGKYLVTYPQSVLLTLEPSDKPCHGDVDCHKYLPTEMWIPE